MSDQDIKRAKGFTMVWSNISVEFEGDDNMEYAIFDIVLNIIKRGFYSEEDAEEYASNNIEEECSIGKI